MAVPGPESVLPQVHLHSLLAWHGGAARIATLLRNGVERAGGHVFSTCEVQDGPEPWTHRSIMATDVARAVAEPCVVHVHGTKDWTGCLAALMERGVQPVITLHDCSLLTGGCPYPLDCPGLVEGCLSPCPRGFVDALSRQHAQRTALRAAGARLVAPSGWLRALARQALPDVSCSVIPNGVEMPDASLTRSRARARLGVAPEARVVLFMAHGGEEAHYKSGNRWLETWEAMRPAVPNGLCFMVGGDRHEQAGDVVRWPYVDRENAQLFMAAADCFAYPTLADNHPLVVLEAMSLGCPVVSFRVGGLAEQIVDGSDGLLVTPGDWSGFSAACAGLLESPARRRSLAGAARERFARHFTEQRMVQDHLRLYTRLAGQD